MGVVLHLEGSEFPYNTVYDKSKKAPMPKPARFESSVSTKLRLVTDKGMRQTDTGPMAIANTAVAQRCAGKKRSRVIDSKRWVVFIFAYKLTKAVTCERWWDAAEKNVTSRPIYRTL